MIDNEFLQRLRCMHTGSHLALATAELVEEVNAAIDARQLRDHLGRPIEVHLESGLLNDSGTALYPIVNGAVQMLREETIDLSNFKQPDKEL